MTTDKNTIRSKIYTYFYGRNVVFQTFLIVMGIFLLLLSGVGAKANETSYENKLDKLYEAENEAEQAYSDLYYELNSKYDVRYGEKTEIKKGDEGYKDITKLNKALEKHEKAEEKLSKHREKDPGKGFMGVVCTILGVVALAGGIGWTILKKMTYNTDGEAEYDLELSNVISEAREKATAKLTAADYKADVENAIVLSGYAYPRGEDATIRRNRLADMLSALFRFFIAFEKPILFFLGGLVGYFIVSVASRNNVLFVLMSLAFCAGAAFVGMLIYKRYEIQSHVSPKTIEKLNRFVPRLMKKLGGDDRVRTSLRSVTVYAKGQDQLYVYYRYVDMVTGRVFCEGVRECFYKDTVGVTSEQDIKKIFRRRGFLNLFLKDVDYTVETISVVSKGNINSEYYIVDMGSCLHDSVFAELRADLRGLKG